MFLFSSSLKKISLEQFREALKSVPQLSDRERDYLEGAFQGALRDGLSENELKRGISQLKQNFTDQLDSYEVEKAKNKLLELFK